MNSNIKNKTIKFVSGNINKYNEVKDIIEEGLPGYKVILIKLDLPELQGEPEDIVKAKLNYALSVEEGPLIIEDTSLCFNAMNGLPGPYIKDFFEKLGPIGINNMLKGFEDKSGYAQGIFGLGSKEGDINIFIGRTNGKIVEVQEDNNDKYGWPFIPDGFDLPYSHLDKNVEVKNKISHRYNSLKKLIDFLKKNPNYI